MPARLIPSGASQGQPPPVGQDTDGELRQRAAQGRGQREPDAST
jgi:hypothetical protein